MKKVKFIIIFYFLSILIYPNFVLAETDFYVESGANNGDGSKEKPFNKIGDALKKGGKEIFIKNGTYAENLSLGKNVKIKGEDKNKTIIIGNVKMGDDSVAENLTVKNGGFFVGNKISAFINKSIIKNSSIGITTEGSGKLKVANCEISGNTKGFYVQMGKSVDIQSSTITENGGEGIDLRNNIDGVIANNIIKNNSEGGIEVIAGGSNLTIQNNTLENNKASGIAIQYYELANKLGALKIHDNTILKNGNFGIVCKSPSGGNSSGDYWTKSVEMGANQILNNREGSFSNDCKFSTDLKNIATKTPEELKKEEEELAKKKALEEELKTKTKEEENKLAEEKLLAENLEKEKIAKEQKEKELKEKTENLYAEFLKNTENNENLKKEIENRSKIKTFFLGNDYKKLNELTEKMLLYKENVANLTELKKSTENEEIKEFTNSKITEIENELKVEKEFINKEAQKFSLFVWVFEKIGA